MLGILYPLVGILDAKNAGERKHPPLKLVIYRVVGKFALNKLWGSVAIVY